MKIVYIVSYAVFDLLGKHQKTRYKTDTLSLKKYWLEIRTSFIRSPRCITNYKIYAKSYELF